MLSCSQILMSYPNKAYNQFGFRAGFSPPEDVVLKLVPQKIKLSIVTTNSDILQLIIEFKDFFQKFSRSHEIPVVDKSE